MTYFLILILYSFAMILLGFAVSRRVKDTSGFFVANRKLGPGLIFSTLIAANIGAGSTVGATGLGYRDGFSAWWWVGSAGIGSLLLAMTVGPRLWKVAKRGGLYTVGDYLESRYDRRVRALAAALLWLGSLAILSGQLIAMEQIFRVTAGLSKTVGCLLAATVIAAYFSAGGLHASARVNLIQVIVKLGGFALALAYLLTREGTWAAIQTQPTAMLDPFGAGPQKTLGYMALLIPSFMVSPGILQKIFGARDERAVRLGVGLNALALLTFAAIPAVLGILAKIQFPLLENRELALPMLLTHSLPFALGGLLLGALFSAELSAADAVLFMLTTSVSKDWYKTFFRPQASDAVLLKVTRWTAVACSALGALLALSFGSVISALKIFYTLLTAALLLPILAGLYRRKTTPASALAAMLTSILVTFALEKFTGGQGLGGIPCLIYGVAMGALAMAAMERFRSHSKTERGR